MGTTIPTGWGHGAFCGADLLCLAHVAQRVPVPQARHASRQVLRALLRQEHTQGAIVQPTYLNPTFLYQHFEWGSSF